MNYAVYMRQIEKYKPKLIRPKNNADASQVTLINQAKAQTGKIPTPIETNFSHIGGSIGNIMKTRETSPTVCNSGYKGVTWGMENADRQANITGRKQHCQICRDDPQPIKIPCQPYVSPVLPTTAPLKCCAKTGIIFVNKDPLIANEVLTSDLRKRYNLPNKLQGLRGPIVIRNLI